MADIVLLLFLKGRDCMRKVLIDVLVIILIAGSYLILYSAVRVSAISDQRIAEIRSRETFDKSIMNTILWTDWKSYYSVFVNVDLNKAATTFGKALGSEEEIAQYIADMLLLESDSVFNIRYTGTTKTSGETFYEFRCYR